MKKMYSIRNEKMYVRTPTAGKACLLGAMALAAGAVQAADFDAIGKAIDASKPVVDVRLRYEGVDQEPLTEDAVALTLRARIGFETGKAWNTSLLAEGEFVWPLTSDYNSTINGNTEYPVVADPESHEINRLQLTNTSIPQTTVTLGRQRINLEDQRFIGNSGWRQNEQTYDSLRIVNKAVSHLLVDVAYFNQVNRVFGKDSPQGRYEGDSFIGNVSWQFPIGNLTGFGYWLEFDPIPDAPAAARDSSQTVGVRFAGERPLSKAKLAYAASYATQEQYGDNPLSFDNDYYSLELTGTYRHYHVGLGMESLAGDGTKGFTTPLASLHKFQGWADKFGATPVNGIDDRYVSASFTHEELGPLQMLSFQVIFHVYEAERISQDYGSEIDLQLQAKWQRFVVTFKYADYAADELHTDTSKFWAQLEYVW